MDEARGYTAWVEPVDFQQVIGSAISILLGRNPRKGHEFQKMNPEDAAMCNVLSMGMSKSPSELKECAYLVGKAVLEVNKTTQNYDLQDDHPNYRRLLHEEVQSGKELVEENAQLRARLTSMDSRENRIQEMEADLSQALKVTRETRAQMVRKLAEVESDSQEVFSARAEVDYEELRVRDSEIEHLREEIRNISSAADPYLSPEMVTHLIPGMKKAMLAQLRFKGTGPRFYKPTPKTVVYKKSEVIEWVNGLSATRTDEVGHA